MDRFKSSPLFFLAQRIYHWSEHPAAISGSIASASSDFSTTRIVCISDTHDTHHAQPFLPEGDILIHAGDLTQLGSADELRDVLDWLGTQLHAYKIFVAGNHATDYNTRELLVYEHPRPVYLEDSSTELSVRGRTLRIYGSPLTPKYGNWKFQYPHVHLHTSASGVEAEAERIWSGIRPLTDILITHGPPAHHPDLGGFGCAALLKAVWRVYPRLPIFGHIHAARGIEYVAWSNGQKAYEDVCSGRCGWLGLMMLLFCVVIERTNTCLKRGTTRNCSIMVNAAAVGGLKDGFCKGSIVVDI